MTATAPAAPIFPVFDSSNGLTADQVVAMFRAAAARVASMGHNSYAPDSDQPGISMEIALQFAAEEFISTDYRRAPLDGEVRDLVDELVHRLAGVMYVGGLARNTRPYWGVDGVVWSWERDAARGECTKWAVYRTAADVIALFHLAANLVCLVGQ